MRIKELEESDSFYILPIFTRFAHKSNEYYTLRLISIKSLNAVWEIIFTASPELVGIKPYIIYSRISTYSNDAYIAGIRISIFVT